MRFTEGLWQDRCGYKIHRAHNAWRYEITEQRVRVMVPCFEIRTMKDTTSGPLLHFEFSSPGIDMIAVRVFHFSGEVESGPEFALSRSNLPMNVTEDENTITMESGRLKAVINKTGVFAYNFFYDGKRITGGGNKGVSYVTDVDYEADLSGDYNGRKPVKYMKETYIREVLELDVGEYIYGMGERFGPYVKNGQSVDIWNRDGGSCSDQAYKNIPFYLSSKGYGLLVNTPDRVQFEVGSVNVRSIEFSVEGESMEYIVVGGGDPKAVLGNYTGLSGRPDVPPAWSFGLWLSTSWVPDSNAEITMEFIDGMLNRDIPLSVFHFDARWMDDFNCCDFLWSKRFGDPKDLLDKIHERGVNVCVWINPYISQESRLFAEGKANGYFIKNRDGSVYQTDVWMSGMAIVDFTNPAASKWYVGYLEQLVDMGVDSFKTDFGERIPVDVVYHDGSDSRKMHNFYPYLYNEAVYGMLKRKKGDGEACVFSRSSTVGTQKFPVNWGGDNDSTYVSMAETLRGGLSFGQSGFGFWAHDISGFEGTATPDLYKRWSAFGLLSSHSRLHGQESYRVPWCFDEESCEVLRHFTKLKCSLMPYLYSQAVQTHLTGAPMMRAMMLEYPNDPAVLTLDRQYMLGENLLVAPVFKEDGSVDFYLPDGGIWTNILDGEQLEGGHWYHRTYDYFGLPLFAKPGSIIAKGAINFSPVYDYADGVTYQVFLHEDGECRTEIYSKQAQKVDEVSVKRQDGYIYIERTSSSPCTVQLTGISSVKDISGGNALSDESGVVIEIESGSIKIEL